MDIKVNDVFQTNRQQSVNPTAVPSSAGQEKRNDAVKISERKGVQRSLSKDEYERKIAPLGQYKITEEEREKIKSMMREEDRIMEELDGEGCLLKSLRDILAIGEDETDEDVPSGSGQGNGSKLNVQQKKGPQVPLLNPQVDKTTKGINPPSTQTPAVNPSCGTTPENLSPAGKLGFKRSSETDCKPGEQKKGRFAGQKETEDAREHEPIRCKLCGKALVHASTPHLCARKEIYECRQCGMLFVSWTVNVTHQSMLHSL